ncbi:AAA family ATPase [Yersinia enterocolitica]|uniref:ATP-dependent nuclease n=1 Tax=Yersinia enterocolitica TaxID=630 RepID=UPI0030CD4326
MTILIDMIRISGFRGVRNLEIYLPKVTVLIGTNNAGKTSVLKAIQLALGDYSRYITEEDFHIDDEDNVFDKIVIDVRIIPNDDLGSKVNVFSDVWIEEFGDNIQASANGEQFVGLRTTCQHNLVKGGFTIERFALENWPNKENWIIDGERGINKLRNRFDAIPLISIDAQRDIHQELRDRSSFIGKILTGIEYSEKDVEEIERMVGVINDEAVNKSDSLKNLKRNLEKLNQSFNGAGHAEITPFPKKIRDLSKQFTVHFGESNKNSFSMEYHGMGTRSWATMLSVKSFTELMADKYNTEGKPFYPILAAEEPEAHLHPNAQRTLYKQLSSSIGQVIISTHSPYLAAIAEQEQLRCLVKSGNTINIFSLDVNIDNEDKRKIKREIIHSRGEILFSKAIVLAEGETEEQALPQLFSKYFGCDPFTLGVNFIGVGGSGDKYKPYLSFSRDFNIPIFIFSDGEPIIVKQLKKVYESVFGETDINDSQNITILDDNDFEGYLLNNGYGDTIENAILQIDGADSIDKWIGKKHGTSLSPQRTNKPNCVTCKQPIFEQPIRDYSPPKGRAKAIMEIIDKKKPKYAQAIADKLCTLEPGKFPPKIIELFEKIKVGVSL